MEIKLNSQKIKAKINSKEVIKNLFDFNLGSAVTDTLTIEPDIEYFAYNLLFKTSQKTNVELAKRTAQNEINCSKSNFIIAKGIDFDWADCFEKEMVITSNFFESPEKASKFFLTKSYLFFCEYINRIKGKVPDNFESSYYKTFLLNLADEYTNNQSTYSRLITYFDNPVFKNSKYFSNLINHYDHIKDYYRAPLQPNVKESRETLKDLYIEPTFKLNKKSFKQNDGLNDKFYSLKNSIDLHKFITRYYLTDKPHEELEIKNMLFILGQPGQGKTSFCYRVIHDYLIQNHGLPETNLFYIKIRDLVISDFINSTFSTINQFLDQNIDFKNDRALLILDGLDEAFMCGGISNKDLSNLYERLNKATQQNNGLKIILTSRLGYLNIDSPVLNNSTIIEIDVFTKPQIKEYINKFSRFYPGNTLAQSSEAILENNEFTHIKELLEQPVLMYFIALANIVIDKGDSKQKIYNKIFEALSQRSWDKQAGQLDYIKTTVKDNPKKYGKYLRQFIRSVAFKIYQSPQLNISAKQLLSLPATERFTEKCFNTIDNSTSKVEELSKYLLISFYFKKSSNKTNSEDTAIEFFHNSLWEYLTAEYMWQESKTLFLQKDEDGDYVSIKLKDYYNLISKLIGNKKLNRVVRRNLRAIILAESQEIKNIIFKQTEKVFFKLVDNDLLLEYDNTKNTLTAREKMDTIFNLAWELFHSCASANNRVQLDIKTEGNLFIYHTASNVSSLFQFVNSNTGARYSNLNPGFISCVIKHCKFDFRVNFSLYNCQVSDSEIRFITFGAFKSNTFLNIKFIGGTIIYSPTESYYKSSENIFMDCSFKEVTFTFKTTYNSFIKHNTFDDDFLKNHKLTETIIAGSVCYVLDYEPSKNL